MSVDEKEHVGYYLGLEYKDYPKEEEKRTQLSFADDEQEREFHRQAAELQAILDKNKPTPAEEETTIRRLALDPETDTYKTMSVHDSPGAEIETVVKAAEMEALLKDAPLVRQSVPHEDADILSELSEHLVASYKTDLETVVPAGHPLFQQFCDAHLFEMNWISMMENKKNLDKDDRIRVLNLYTLLADRGRLSNPKCYVAKVSARGAIPARFLSDIDGVKARIQFGKEPVKIVYVTEEQAMEFCREAAVKREDGENTFSFFEQIARDEPGFKWINQIVPKSTPLLVTERIAKLYPTEFEGLAGAHVILKPVIQQKVELPDGAVARTGEFKKWTTERAPDGVLVGEKWEPTQVKAADKEALAREQFRIKCSLEEGGERIFKMWDDGARFDPTFKWSMMLSDPKPIPGDPGHTPNRIFFPMEIVRCSRTFLDCSTNRSLKTTSPLRQATS